MKITEQTNPELSVEQKLQAVAEAMSDAELDSHLAKAVNVEAPSDAPIDPASQFSCFGCE